MSWRRIVLARVRARLHPDEHGFTMVEAMIAILISGLLIGGIATMQSTTLNLIRNNRHRSVAANLAASEMDTVRSTPFTSLPLGQVQFTKVVGRAPHTIAYTIVRESEWIASESTAGACDAPQGSEPAYLRIVVRVTWPHMSGVQPVVSDTIVTPPVGTYDSTTGHLAVKVLDRDGGPQAGVPVSIAGAENLSQTTSSEGCVFFAFLTPGAYSTTLSRSGYVSDQGEPAPSQSATVITSATTSLLFLYDQSSVLNLTLIGKDASSAAPLGVPVTLGNTHILPAGIKLVPGSGSPRTILDLFPYADGYEAWAGGCSDADPAFHSAGRSPPIAVEPGQTSTGVVAMPEIRVTVQDDTGTPLPGRQVDAVHAPDTGCPSGESYAIGQTDALGEITFALPYGTWQIEVDDVVMGVAILTPTDPLGPLVMSVTQ
jgi:type II secretory pathway pseudopilin PulG